MHDTGETQNEKERPGADEPTRTVRTVVGVSVAVAVAALVLGVLWALDWPRHLFLGYVAVKLGIKGGLLAFAGVIGLVAWWRERRAKREGKPLAKSEEPSDGPPEKPSDGPPEKPAATDRTD
ncbi:hypothetical protein ACF09L_10410 [Streptomyces sp. NPDC014779]|uniref:hypothetical protein n=1 Tax=Streptomyces sp. NPDC014779 TaxID=3364911 RepID=UPI0036FC7EFF